MGSLIEESMAELESRNGGFGDPVSPATREIPEPKIEGEEPPAAESESAEQESQETEQHTETEEEPRYIEIDGKQIKIDPDKSVDDYVKDSHNFQKGMRKYQVERDEAKRLFKEAEPTLEKWNKLNETFQKNGMDGVIDLLAGEEGAADKFRQQIAETAIKKFNASEEELEAIERDEKLQRAEEAKQRAEKEKEEFISKFEAREQEAQRKELEAKVNPAFFKHSFDGKLGDAEAESKFNSIMFNEVRDNLAKYAEEQGIAHNEVPQEVINSEFAKTSKSYQKMLKVSADNKFKETVAKKQEKAKQGPAKLHTAQSAAKEAASPSTDLNSVASEYTKKHGTVNGLLSKILGG